MKLVTVLTLSFVFSAGAMAQAGMPGSATVGRSLGEVQNSNVVELQRREAVERVHHGPLNDESRRLPSWQMLQKQTGMTAEQLDQMYQDSGVKRYGQFAEAMLAAKSLNLDAAKVFVALKSSKKLETALEQQGIARKEAKKALQAAERQMEAADLPQKDTL